MYKSHITKLINILSKFRRVNGKSTDWTEEQRKLRHQRFLKAFNKGQIKNSLTPDVSEKLATESEDWGQKFVDNFNKVMMKPSPRANENTKPQLNRVTILGVEIDEESFPVLYEWAEFNPETLEKQVKSIAEKWHGGNVITAMQMLEMDLEHEG